MSSTGLGLICIQETHRLNSDYFITEEGFFVILSGSAGTDAEHAGVGFIVAPCLRCAVVSFRQENNRMAALKLRVPGGKVVFVSAYAPHSGKPYIERQAFYRNISSFASNLSSHGPKFLMGDWNARLYRAMPGDGGCIGPYIFSDENAICQTEANRHLLVELCASMELIVANTFCEALPEQLATCRNVGHTYTSNVNLNSHSQIDFLLCNKDFAGNVQSVWVAKDLALASHHYAVFAELALSIPKDDPRLPRTALEPSGLKNKFTSNRFSDLFDEQMEATVSTDAEDLNLTYACLLDAFHAAAERTLPTCKATQRRPWISDCTLALIERRGKARRDGRVLQEHLLNIEVRRSVTQDRGRWLDVALAIGDWDVIRRLRKGFTPKQGRLKDHTGACVDSNARADTLAHHLMHVQWAVRDTTPAQNNPTVAEVLPVNLEAITEEEGIRAGKRLKSNKACGLDSVLGEYWAALLTLGSSSSRWIIDFCNAC